HPDGGLGGREVVEALGLQLDRLETGEGGPVVIADRLDRDRLVRVGGVVGERRHEDAGAALGVVGNDDGGEDVDRAFAVVGSHAGRVVTVRGEVEATGAQHRSEN